MYLSGGTRVDACRSSRAELLLIDPLLPADPALVHELVDAEGREEGIAVLITISYHVRNAERLRRKRGKHCTIWAEQPL